AADEKRPFTAGKPVHADLRRVAPDERPLADLLLDRVDRAQDARVVRRQKAEDRDEQQARLQAVPTVVLDERVALRLVAFGQDLGMNLVASGSPAVEGRIVPCRLEVLDRAID